MVNVLRSLPGAQADAFLRNRAVMPLGERLRSVKAFPLGLALPGNLPRRAVGKWTGKSASDLAHDREQIAVRVLEEGHPQLMIRHRSDQVGWALELHGALRERTVRLL